jgi:hypothetical protein
VDEHRRSFEPADHGYKGNLDTTKGDVVMYTGGLLATLLLLGIVLVVILLAVVISEPRDVSPSTRENPSDITRRLRSQTAPGRKPAGSDGAKS